MMLSDTMFKEMMSPETVPGRLEDFLSAVLGMSVRVVKLLPNEEHSIEDNYSLLVFDILVELSDGSLANVEMQRIGYLFPGARAACYSADLLLRQYKRMRSEKKRKEGHFTYRQIKDVYTIILYENSPSCFHEYPEHYIHRFAQQSDTGLRMELLQKYIMIPLDIFREIQHNKDTADKLSAWIGFFCMREPEKMIQIMEAYPEFQAYYEDAYRLCMDMGRYIGMYSRELRELDHNTVQLMIDLMQEDLEKQKATTKELQEQLSQQSEQLNQKDDLIQQKDECLLQKDEKIRELQEALERAMQQKQG